MDEYLHMTIHVLLTHLDLCSQVVKVLHQRGHVLSRHGDVTKIVVLRQVR